jgi:hypothetical protein
VRFVLPPPGSLELYGLLDGLAEQFRALGVPYEVRHRRGAEARVQMVADGDVDATFISRGASRTLGERIAAGALELRELGPDTYYADGSIVVLARQGVDRDTDPATLRVGVDAESFDHAALTEAEFQRARGYAFVACRFPEIPVAVLDGRVDVGIWHRVLLLISPELAGLVARPLREPAALDARRELSPGVLVWASARPEVTALCRSLDGDAIRARQRRLLETRDPGVLSERYWLR